MYDKDGQVLDTESGYLSMIFPGEMLGQAANVMIPQGKVADHIEVQLSTGRTAATDLTENPLKGDKGNLSCQLLPGQNYRHRRKHAGPAD